MANENLCGLPTKHLAPNAEEVRVLLREASSRGVHPGLLFDRYLPVWVGDDAKTDYDFFKKFKALYRDLREWGQPLLNEQLRRLSAVSDQKTATVFSLKLESPLVLGLGLDHYTGNGFLFDPVVGVPWLPGTAVKGLCRRGAQLVNADPLEQKRILGPENVSAEGGPAIGELVFLDAWPESWPELEIQVLNPHYISYQRWLNKVDGEEGGPPQAEAPHGLEDPVPVYHLSVSEGIGYRFGIVSRNGEEKGLAMAQEWLETGLACLGAGGRTALGFGAFEGAWGDWQ